MVFDISSKLNFNVLRHSSFGRHLCTASFQIDHQLLALLAGV